MAKQGEKLDPAKSRTHSKLFHVRHVSAKRLDGKIKSKLSIKSSDDKSFQMGPMHHCSFCPISCYKGLKPQNCSEITHIYSELDPL